MEKLPRERDWTSQCPHLAGDLLFPNINAWPWHSSSVSI